MQLTALAVRIYNSLQQPYISSSRLQQPAEQPVMQAPIYTREKTD